MVSDCRYEKSGVVHGLTRMRGFTQDDSHTYCTPEQAVDDAGLLVAVVVAHLEEAQRQLAVGASAGAGFTQDDSHTYCTPEQAGEEIRAQIDFFLSILQAFGLTDFYLELSTRDEDGAKKDRRSGGPAWRRPSRRRSR